MPSPINDDMPTIPEAHEVRDHIAELVAESFVWDVAIVEGLKLGRRRAAATQNTPPESTQSDEQPEVDL